MGHPISSLQSPASSSPQIKVSDHFGQWLRLNKLSLAFTTYQTNRLVFLGTKDDNTLTLKERLFDKPMGLYASNDGDSLYMATRYQVWQFHNLLSQGEKYYEHDRLYVPRLSYTTGSLNVHDVAVDGCGQLLFVNTDFSCLATVEQGYSFKPLWQPCFIDQLRSEDRCHLNGLALVDGEAAYMTACSATNTPAGWRNCRLNGGILLHIPSNDIVTEGLSMPHSPRWYQGKLWLLNAGTGELGYIDNHQFIAVAFCPGFVRGLGFWKNYAFVGLSKLRAQSFTGLTLENRLIQAGMDACCGLQVIDITTGETIHYLRFETAIEELFDVVTLPNILSPQVLGFQDEDIERLITFPNSEGIVTTKPTVQRPGIGEKPPIAGLPNQQRLAEERTLTANEPVKYQRVYHLNPESLAPYDTMTFPRLQTRWQSQSQRGELWGISASIAGDMVGFVIAEVLPDNTADIISLFVADGYRRRGIATKMLILLEDELVKEKAIGIQIIYDTAPFIDTRLTPLLQKLAWRSPIAVGKNQKQAVKALLAAPPSSVSPRTVNPQATLKFEAGKQRFKNDDIEGAIAAFRESIQIQSDYIPAYHQLGNALQAIGKTDEAIQTYQHLLKINPNIAPAYNNLGSCLQIQNRIDEAISAYQKAIQLQPDFSQAYSNLAILFSNQGKFTEAENCLREILGLRPQNPQIYYDLGNLLRSTGRNDEAIDCFRRAIKLKPDYGNAYQNLGCMLMMRNQMSLAQLCFEKVLKLEPNNAECYGNYANVLEAQDRFPAALQAYDRALSLKPDALNLLYQKENLRLTLCDWQDFDARMALLEEKIRCYLAQDKTPLLVPLVLNTFNFPIALHRQINQKWGYHITRSMAQLKQHNAFPPRLQPKNKLRIGYVSADFRCHAMGSLVYQIFQHHNRASFEVYCYSIGDYGDEMTAIVEQGCDQFVNITSMSPSFAAETIYQDEIDILIDLMGYTNLSRPQIFALQPAPIQVAYLGHPNTMGADFIQYILADETIIPPELDRYYTETVIRLPHAFVASEVETATQTVTRSDFGLPDGAVVYGCFNRSNKINPHLFSIWLEILRQVPSGVLWFFEDHQAIRENLQKQANAAGIDPQRLIFSDKLPLKEFVKACSLADLLLDSYIYNGGSTTVCALQGGLPVLTCTGEIFVSRMGASLCKAVGLESLICQTPMEYQAKAIELGNNPSALADLKNYLITEKDNLPLFNTKQWVVNFETHLTAIWEDFLRVNNGLNSDSKYQFLPSHDFPGNLFTITKTGLTPFNNPGMPPIRLVCATRETKEGFFTKTALGRSLLNYTIPALEVKLVTENSLGLPIIYNHMIEESANDPALLIFIHDDVSLADPHWLSKVLKALTVFDVVGLAGNKRRLPQQPGWYFTDLRFTPDTHEHLSGVVAHSQASFSQLSLYGAFFEPVKLLDGLMLVCHSHTLINNDIRFDEQFDFHCYDMDFCRQAEHKELTMGTWNIFVAHVSGGQFGSEHYLSNYDKYRRKWEE